MDPTNNNEVHWGYSWGFQWLEVVNWQLKQEQYVDVSQEQTNF